MNALILTLAVLGGGYNHCHVPHVKHVVVQQVFAVPHAYPGLYAAHSDVAVPSRGDQAAYHAAQLEKLRLEVASDMAKIAAADAAQKTVFSFGVGTSQTVNNYSHAKAECVDDVEVNTLGDVDLYKQYCQSCHSGANKAKGGGHQFDSFADLSVDGRVNAANLVSTGEMPDNHAPLPADVRLELIKQISGCK